MYHASSHLFTASRVGSGRRSGANASSVTVTRRRGAKTNRFAAHSPSPRSSPIVRAGRPSAQLNMLPHSPRVRASTTVTFGTAASTSAAVRAPPRCSAPSRDSRPLGHRITFSPARSAAITSPTASSARRRSSALAFTMSGILMPRSSHDSGLNSGFWKFDSSRSGRIWKRGHSRTSRFGGSQYAGWLGMMRYGPGRCSTSAVPTTVTL